MTMSILTFAIMLNAILADLKAAENKKYRFDVAVKSLDYAIRKYFISKKKYRYITN